VTPTPIEASAMALARGRFAERGIRPEPSGALIVAARILAEEVAHGEDAAQRRSLRNALARALSYDPAPAFFSARAPAGRWRAALARALGKGGATHVGAGAVEVDGELVIVLLASRRGAHLDPFPRAVTVGERAVLSGRIGAGLCNPRVFVSAPSGTVRTIDATDALRIRATVPFDEPGRHVVEVLADGPRGPTVAALLAVAAGGAPFEEPASPSIAADGEGDPARAEVAVFGALQAARARQGLTLLTLDPALTALARRHSEAMRAAGTIGHVLPGEPDPTARLDRARIAYRRVYENVAVASTGLEAHAAVEESPAHLRNMLEPGARRAGVGVARDARPGGDVRVYLTEILVE
jgi:uncharacterized protein YkwD